MGAAAGCGCIHADCTLCNMQDNVYYILMATRPGCLARLLRQQQVLEAGALTGCDLHAEKQAVVKVVRPHLSLMSKPSCSTHACSPSALKVTLTACLLPGAMTAVAGAVLNAPRVRPASGGGAASFFPALPAAGAGVGAAAALACRCAAD